jgi:CRISPR/Cas system-associated exonuclease Cas4 (RecB family)
MLSPPSTALQEAKMNISTALIEAIYTKRTVELARKIQSYPRAVSILSDISECERQMVYGVLDWKSRKLFEVEVQARLEAGNVQEREIVNELTRMGFDVILSQQPVDVLGKSGKVIARGKIDGMIKFEGKKVPFEIKSMNPNIYNGIKSLEDFQKKPYLRKYLRQIQMYLFGNNLEEGIFILTDCLGHLKLLPVFLDYGECEAILLKLERVASAIDSKTYPDRIPYDTSICGWCPFSLICLPDITNTPAELIIDEAVETAVSRHEELKPLAKEFDDLHEEIREKFANIEKAIIGDKFIVMNVPSKRTAYELSKEAEAQIAAIKKEFAKQVPMFRLVIEHLDKKEQDA